MLRQVKSRGKTVPSLQSADCIKNFAKKCKEITDYGIHSTAFPTEMMVEKSFD